MKKTYLFLITVLFINFAKSQNIWMFPGNKEINYFFENNYMFVNPAFTGAQKNFSASYTHNVVYYKFNSYQKIYVGSGALGVDKNINNTNSSLGLTSNYSAGTSGKSYDLYIAPSYSYRVNFEKNKLLLGAGAGLLYRRINLSYYTGESENDPINKLNYNKEYINFTVGSLYKAQNTYAGLSVSFLNQPYKYLDFKGTIAYFSAGHSRKISEKISVQANTFFSYNFNSSYNFKLNLTANYTQKYFFGISYEKENNISALSGIKFKQFDIGISCKKYNLSWANYMFYNELFIAYNINYK